MKLLHVDSSITGPGSISRMLTAEIVQGCRLADPTLAATYRDLAADPVGHLSGAHLLAAHGAVPEAPAVQQDLDLGASMLQEFLAADVVVVGAPMYNFNVPTQLKAWIDRLSVAGVTFRYTEKGSEGLCVGKRVIIASSRGNIYAAGTPNASLDHQETYLRSVFGFLGITDVTVIRAEGVALGAEERAAAMAGAKREAHALAA